MSETATKLPNVDPRTKPARVVLIHPGRCGSTVLADLFGQNPSIAWAGKLFNDKTWIKSEFFPDRPLKYIQTTAEAAHESTYGFEVHYHDLLSLKMSFEQFIQHLTELGFDHFIALTRRNYLKHLVSASVANQRQHWHDRSTETAKLTTIEIDPTNANGFNNSPINQLRRTIVQTYGMLKSRLMSKSNKTLEEKMPIEQDYWLNLREPIPLVTLFEHWDKSEARLAEALANLNHLKLVYEDDIEGDPVLAYEKVCRFLHLQQSETTVNYAKTTPFRLNDVIRNFGEISKSLEDTPYRWMTGE